MKLEPTKLALALSSAILFTLTGCGGGGGGSSVATGGTSGSVVSGTASKGLLKNALVTAYCGVKPSNPVGTATTDTSGNYSLTLTSTCSQPVEIVVTAKASGTTILDEISGTDVAAPSNLSMRAFVPASGSTITQQVTPFTDMAAALVENAVTNNSTPLSAGVVSNANTAIVTNVLGGNAGLFNAAPLAPSQYSAAGTTPDQQQLITILSSIAAAAQNLTGATPGDKIQAVLNQLATQATQTIPTVTSTSYGLASTVNTAATSGSTATPLATINAGLTAIGNGNAVVAGAPPALATTATTLQTSVVAAATTQITTTQTAGGTVTPPNTATQTAIAAVQQLLTKLRANLLTTGTGFLQTQSTAMTADFNNVVATQTYALGQTASAIGNATKFLLDVDSAAVTPPAVLANATAFVDATSGNYYKRTWGSTAHLVDYMECRAYTTSGAGLSTATPPRNTALASDPLPAVAVCNYFPFNGDPLKQMQFVVTQTTTSPVTGATFGYKNRLRTWGLSTCTRYYDATCAVTDSLQQTGTFTANWDSNGVTGVAFNGPLVPFDGLGTVPTTLALTLNGASTATSTSFNMAGGLTNGSISFAFSQGTLAANSAAGTSSINLVGRAQTSAFRYDGSVIGNATGTNSTTPSGTLGFTGAISSMSGSTATPFLEGSLSANASAKTAAFSGKVTNGTNVNNISGSLDESVAGQASLSMTYLFPGYSITSSGTSYDNLATPSTITSTASNGTKMVVTRSGSTSTVTFKDSGNATIGTATGNQVNFTDGSYLILN